jgi:hypothetical protein
MLLPTLLLASLLTFKCSNASQNVSNEIDLPSTLSKYADLDSFTSLLNNFPGLLSRLENGNVTS